MSLTFFLGRRLGELWYYFDSKHKATAYANIKKAFGAKSSPCAIAGLTRSFYQNFGQSLMEVFLIPSIDSGYIDKYITIEGKERVLAALNKGRGAILVAVHAGSWELANIISANLGFAFHMFVRAQGLPRLNRLLNEYRRNKGCRILNREDGLKGVIFALSNNEAVGMTIDQGGASGVLVDFLGRPASMPTGAVKLALKYKAALIPIFFARIKGPRIKVWAGEEIGLLGDEGRPAPLEESIKKAVSVFEDFILKYPQEYLWTYKIWKRSNLRKILILSDGRTGHLRQSEAVAYEVRSLLAQRGINSEIKSIQVRFKNRFSSLLFNLCVLLSGRYSCQGCLLCLSKLLDCSNYKELSLADPDIIISAGSSVAGANFILSRESLSKSIVVMRPALLSAKRFDLIIAPRHDRMKKRKNTVITDTALNLINEDYLNRQAGLLAEKFGLNKNELYIALLIGGNSRSFRLCAFAIREVLKQAKVLAQELGAGILLTTSRRTPKEAAEAIKNELGGSSLAKLMVIANENNTPEAVGGMLGLSSIIVATPESISMISEAVSSKKYVFTFNAPGLSRKHRGFLKYLSSNKYIYLSEISDLSSKVKEVWGDRPQAPCLKDKGLLCEALKRVL